ncbi:lipid III flippase WzxE, partial [Proteus mirabilis]|nr:lipid III flippase WzxE [Proteus mirabilis]
QDYAVQRKNVLGTSSSMIFLFSTLLAILFLIFTTPIRRVLFGDDYLQYLDIVRMVALIQMGIAYANYFLAILKGYRD